VCSSDLDGDPLHDLADLRRVHLVLREGAVVVKNGCLAMPAAKGRS